ncbi:MAG TPA: hypothetical protein VGP22_15685, partial [Albitalea sp.]|nr:hypothetical protein [Albitalea sp.]
MSIAPTLGIIRSRTGLPHALCALWIAFALGGCASVSEPIKSISRSLTTPAASAESPAPAAVTQALPKPQA